MPLVATIPALTATMAAAGAGATAAAGIYGANKQSSAAKNSASAQERSNAEALQWERDQDAMNRTAYDAAEAENKRRWAIEADRDEGRYALTRGDQARSEGRDIATYNAEQSRRQPYRDISLAAANDLANKLGLQIRTTAAPQLANNTGAGYTAQKMSDLLAAANKTKASA